MEVWEVSSVAQRGSRGWPQLPEMKA